jgi:hypothetical protein
MAMTNGAAMARTCAFVDKLPPAKDVQAASVGWSRMQPCPIEQPSSGSTGGRPLLGSPHFLNASSSGSISARNAALFIEWNLN